MDKLKFFGFVLLALLCIPIVLLLIAFVTSTYFEVGLKNEADWSRIIYLNTSTVYDEGINSKRVMHFQQGKRDLQQNTAIDIFFLWETPTTPDPNHPDPNFAGYILKTGIGAHCSTKPSCEFVFQVLDY